MLSGNVLEDVFRARVQELDIVLLVVHSCQSARDVADGKATLSLERNLVGKGPHGSKNQDVAAGLDNGMSVLWLSQCHRRQNPTRVFL